MGASEADPDIDQRVATNVRVFRERAGLSQDDLAQRMSERNFGFSQATIWKIETGQRAVRIGEAVALAQALELPGWVDLTREPETNRHVAELHAAARATHAAYEQLKQAATAYLETQIDVVFALRMATDAGLRGPLIEGGWSAWADTPAERAVIEARIDWDRQDTLLDDRETHIEAIMQALREHGHTPPRPDELELGGPDGSGGSVRR